MKSDKARKWTEWKLEVMERRLHNLYSNAQKEITAKWNKYMENAEKRVKTLENGYKAALKSGDATAIKETKEKLQKAQKSITIRNNQYRQMVEETTRQLANVNITALAYVNNQLPSIYLTNYNQAKEVAESVGMNFTLVNENTVKQMVTRGDIKLPKKKVSIPKDMRWNTKQLNSSVLQGILQGESMDKIAGRILPVVGNNENAAIRNARTMVTGAENRGRLDSYRRLEDDGMVLNKVWLATADGRTREWHLSMDGQEVPVDDYFIDGNGNELEYPGDPDAEPETVYNCRCSMITHVIGFRKADGQIEYVESGRDATIHEDEIEEERRSREEEKRRRK